MDDRIEKFLRVVASGFTKIDFNDPNAAWDDSGDALNNLPDVIVEAREILEAAGKDWKAP